MPPEKPRKLLDDVVIRFVGDSGDGMQLTGSQFTRTSAIFGNDVGTLPDYPAEIRAPAGSLAGVSGFQIHFSSHDITTPGDAPDVLVAMNPAALKTNLGDLRDEGVVIVNTDAFTEGNLKKAGYAANPLEDGTLQRWRVYPVPISRLNEQALAASPLSKKEVERCKNFFALGLMYWMYDRPLDTTIQWVQAKFKHAPEVGQANEKTLKAGYHYGETAEIFEIHYQVPQASLKPGRYRNITGNEATALGFVAAARLAGKPLYYASYPITPASDVLHELSKLKHLGVLTFQAEDEIAAVGAAIGASFAGGLALTGTSGPGVALKSEAINLAIMAELPLVILNVQRGGPSTGLPTKTEQADLLQALFGRNGESPIAILAAASPSDCFAMAIEAFRLAVRYMTPVFLLSDGYIGNGAEPWLIPPLDQLPKIDIKYRTKQDGFFPYLRDPKTLARPWAIPGTPGLEHRIGGLEKADVTGNVSYDPLNHDKMVRLRAEKIARIAEDIPKAAVQGPEEGELLLVSWGGTCGAVTAAADLLQKQGKSVAHLHLRHLNPFPRNLGEVLGRYEKILVPELNLGQLAFVLRGRYLVDARSYSKVQGKPFRVQEIVAAAEQALRQPNEVNTPWQAKPSALPL